MVCAREGMGWGPRTSAPVLYGSLAISLTKCDFRFLTFFLPYNMDRVASREGCKLNEARARPIPSLCRYSGISYRHFGGEIKNKGQ